jgi:hypothetical protein
MNVSLGWVLITPLVHRALLPLSQKQIRGTYGALASQKIPYGLELEQTFNALLMERI